MSWAPSLKGLFPNKGGPGGRSQKVKELEAAKELGM